MKKVRSFTMGRSLLAIPVVSLALTACNYSSTNQKEEQTMETKEELPTFVIEREVEGAGNLTGPELKEASKESNAVLEELGPDIQWEQSYVVDNKLYCVYRAKNEALIKEHARKVGVPAKSISRVAAVIDPHTAD